ncbi:MAG: hypothetical protein SPJ34_04560 [Candidatus Ornithospirochaeta sp.]|nr:hypothetical protein [Candidatus Ornithospirochaeta sp.]
MAGSVASYVKTIINRSPFISEMLIQEVISFSNLAKFIQPKVEALYGRSVNTSAIVMAIRRYAEDLKSSQEVQKTGHIDYELSMKTNIYDVNFLRNDSFMSRLSELYDRVHPESGDFLNVTIGSYEISLSVSQKYAAIVDDLIRDQEIVYRMTDLVALTILFHGDFLQTPGLLYLAVRKLAWENINVIEIVSTMNVLTFVIKREDSLKAYESLQTFLDSEI